MKKIKEKIKPHFLAKTFLLSSVVCVIIIELTDLRPFGAANNADGVNNIILTLSYSYTAAYVFYFLHDWLPMRFRRRIAQNYVEREMRQLKEFLRLCMLLLYPFSSISETDLSKDKFMEIAGRKNLMAPSIIGSKTILEQLNIYKQRITDISETLMSSYYDAMNDKHIKFVYELLNSCFISNKITPIVFDLPDEYIDSYPNNQWDVCESIYDNNIKVQSIVF
ncbi:MAG: hypothetical protein IJL54_04225 [Prevotella sp.]|nr:hypothetical protein [Prevotella sp.]